MKYTQKQRNAIYRKALEISAKSKSFMPLNKLLIGSGVKWLNAESGDPRVRFPESNIIPYEVFQPEDFPKSPKEFMETFLCLAIAMTE